MDLRQRVQESLSGTHTIERELGGGGMSRVFVADEHRLGVALHRVRSALGARRTRHAAEGGRGSGAPGAALEDAAAVERFAGLLVNRRTTQLGKPSQPADANQPTSREGAGQRVIAGLRLSAQLRREKDWVPSDGESRRRRFPLRDMLSVRRTS